MILANTILIMTEGENGGWVGGPEASDRPSTKQYQHYSKCYNLHFSFNHSLVIIGNIPVNNIDTQYSRFNFEKSVPLALVSEI